MLRFSLKRTFMTSGPRRMPERPVPRWSAGSATSLSKEDFGEPRDHSSDSSETALTAASSRWPQGDRPLQQGGGRTHHLIAARVVRAQPAGGAPRSSGCSRPFSCQRISPPLMSIEVSVAIRRAGERPPTVRLAPLPSPVFCLIEDVALCLVCPSAASGKGRLKGTAGAKVIGTQQGTITNSIQEIGLPGFKVD